MTGVDKQILGIRDGPGQQLEAGAVVRDSRGQNCDEDVGVKSMRAVAQTYCGVGGG